MEFYYCKSCDKILPRENFWPGSLKKLDEGLYKPCSNCANNYKNNYNKTKRDSSGYKIRSTRYSMRKNDIRKIQIDNIRALYRLWCITGVMPFYEPLNINNIKSN